MGATGPSMSWDPWPHPVARAAVGQKSVHRSAETAPRCRSGAFVYTVATRGPARVAPPLGWRLRRGVNPHKPPKSPAVYFIFLGEAFRCSSARTCATSVRTGCVNRSAPAGAPSWRALNRCNCFVDITLGAATSDPFNMRRDMNEIKVTGPVLERRPGEGSQLTRVWQPSRWRG